MKTYILENQGKGTISVTPEQLKKIAGATTSSGGITGDYIPLTGTEVGKPVTGGLLFGSNDLTTEITAGQIEFRHVSGKYSTLFSGGEGYFKFPDKTRDIFILATLDDIPNNSYSTQETKTGGTWIDGKPIYRKVVTGTMESTNTPLWIFTSDFQIEKMIKYDGMIKGINNANDWMSVFSNPFSGEALYIYFSYDSSTLNGIGIFPKANTRYYDKEIFLILEYTKTTD